MRSEHIRGRHLPCTRRIPVAGFARIRVGAEQELNSCESSYEDSTAFAAFRKAEAMQKERLPQYPLLYSQEGYQYDFTSREATAGTNL